MHFSLRNPLGVRPMALQGVLVIIWRNVLLGLLCHFVFSEFNYLEIAVIIILSNILERHEHMFNMEITNLE